MEGFYLWVNKLRYIFMRKNFSALDSEFRLRYIRKKSLNKGVLYEENFQRIDFDIVDDDIRWLRRREKTNRPESNSD